MNRRGKKIIYGDKIFARVTKNGKTILDYVTDKVSTMTELIGELRIAMKDLRGLVMIHIRNYHQGWGEERPLMLYAPKMPSIDNIERIITESPRTSSAQRMLNPWEVH